MKASDLEAAVRAATAELNDLERRSGLELAMQVAVAQMVAAAAFMEAHTTQRADQVVSALWRPETGALLPPTGGTLQ